MQRYVILAIAVVAVIVVAVGIYTIRQWSYTRATTDVIDKDFVATISATGTPLVVDVVIRKVNPKAHKQIKGVPIMVDLALKDRAGKVYGGDYTGRPQYASLVSGDVFDFRKSSSDSLRCKLRVVTDDLKPGNYEVTPVVRIVETGDGALSGPYSDGGTVAVPADNSVEIAIK